MRQLWILGVALVMVFPAMPVWSTGGGAAQAESCPVTEDGDANDEPCPNDPVCFLLVCYPPGNQGPGPFMWVDSGPGSFMQTDDHSLKRLFNRNDMNAAVR